MISKLTALRGRKEKVPIKKGDIVLYLGASHGITPKIVADLVGKEGFVFCLEISKTVMKELLNVCEENDNIAPLLFDANKPEEYRDCITEVNLIYQDLAQRDQVEILLKNINLFLRDGGHFILMLKAKSIDAVRTAGDVLEDVKKKLDGLDIINIINLESTHKGHYAIIGDFAS